MKTVIKMTIIFLFASVFFLSKREVFATDVCKPQYEVCPPVEIDVDKKVQDPRSGSFVDNLDFTDHKFFANDEVVFRIRVENTGERNFDQVEVRDFFPSILEHISGDREFEIKDFGQGEVEERELKARVISESKMPADKDIICDFNEAAVKADGIEDKDTARICISKRVVGEEPVVIEREPEVLPKTGSGAGSAVFGLSIVNGILGLALVIFGKKQPPL